MLIRNNTDTKFEYRAHGKCYVINPKTVTFFEDDGMLTEKELKDTYGTRIRIMKEDIPFPEIKETKFPLNVKKESELKERTCDLTDAILGDILNSVKNEIDIPDSQIDNDWDLNLKLEQEMIEDIEKKNEAKSAQTMQLNQDDISDKKEDKVSTKKGRKTSGQRATRTKRVSRKKV